MGQAGALPARQQARRIKDMAQLNQRREGGLNGPGETMRGNDHLRFVVVAANPGAAARARRQAIAFEEDHQQERQQQRAHQQQRDHRLRHGGARGDDRQRDGAAQQRQQPRRGDAARHTAQRKPHHTEAHEPGRVGRLRGGLRARRTEERHPVDLRHTHHRQRAGNREPHRQQRPKQARDKQRLRAQVKERLINHPLARKAIQRRQRGHRHQAHQHGDRNKRHGFADAAELFDIAQAGAVKDRARAEKQRGFKQAVIEEMIKPAHQAERHQRRLAKRNADKPRAEPQQNNADVLKRVVRQQPLDVVLKQRVKPADKRGHHAEQQHQHAAPERQRGVHQRKDQDAVEPHFQHHGGEERGGGRGGLRMALHHAAVQRDYACEQPEARQSQQPGDGAKRLPGGERT
ncbi:hypothetical protein BN132_261 [Cronobacter turicensis 564]|nr:hypothetical protein BN132_261 [Cronobacter turicensis 564]